jgi:porin
LRLRDGTRASFLYADGGTEFIGLSDTKPKDKFGVAAGYARVSSRAPSMWIFSNRSGWPLRSFESLVTAV